MSLFMRVLLANAAVLAAITLLLLFTPIEISYPVTNTQATILVTGFIVSVAVNLVLLRGVIAPLRRLTAMMRSVEPLQPGRRLSIRGADADVRALTSAFNDMLDRLEDERRESGRQALLAQEAERERVARELHDEVGQVLTSVVLELEHAARRTSGDDAVQLAGAREAVRHSLEDVRRIARELRPETLDHLGLQSALRSLCTNAAAHHLHVDRRIETIDAVSPEVELVVYRVAAGEPDERHAPRGRLGGARRPRAGRRRAAAGRPRRRPRPAGAGQRRRGHRGDAGARLARRRPAGGLRAAGGRHGGAPRHPAPGGPGMSAPLKTRILLADDHPMVCRGLRMVLEAEPDLTVVAEASDGREAVRLALETEADLAVLDVAMPQLTGLQAAAELKRRRPELRTLMLSMYDSEQYFFEALKAGASGYVLKSAADRDLVEACRAAMRGEPFLYPAAIAALIRDYLDRAGRGEAIPADPLTPRELEIVKLVAEGHTTGEIADTLVIAKKTVEHHRSHILEKLGMRDRVELTRYAIRRGLVEP